MTQNKNRPKVNAKALRSQPKTSTSSKKLAAVAKKKTPSKKSHRVTKRLTLRDRLSQLTYRAACRLHGTDGEQMLRQSNRFSIDPVHNINLMVDTLVAKFVDPDAPGSLVRVTIVEQSGRNQGLQLNCDCCHGTCLHTASVLSTVLESKLVLGLSEVPDMREPLENLTEKELLLRAVAERELRAQAERMRVKAHDGKTPWSDYTLTSLESGKSYRVSIRGTELGQSYCSCPDFAFGEAVAVLELARSPKAVADAAALQMAR